MDDGWCQSKQCIDGACAVDGCQALTSECWSVWDCCSGMCTYDSGIGPYEPGHCASKLWWGADCQDDSWCVSGQCVDSVCQ
jgi:hypothetical protein